MNSFYVGQRVVCIDDNWTGLSPWWIKRTKKPVKGNVYTIRNMFVDKDEIGIRLVEIINPCICGPRKEEAGFAAYRFRPVKETNIDNLLKLKHPGPNERTKLANVKRKQKQFEYEIEGEDDIFSFR